MQSVMAIFKRKDVFPFCGNQMYEVKFIGSWSFGSGYIDHYEIETSQCTAKCTKEYLEEKFHVLKGGERLLLENETVLIFHGKDPISGDVCFSDEMSGKLITESVTNLRTKRYSLLGSHSCTDSTQSHKCELVNVSFNFVVMACKVCGKPG